MTLKERAANLKRDIPAVFLALKSQKTPFFAKILAAVTVAYALSPIDLIPDFIPVLGYLDDVLLLPGLVALTLRLIPQEVLAECREKAQGMWQGGRPKKWYYALPILFFWFLIRHSETTAVKVSVHGAAIHTPFIPKIAGRINVNTNNSTIPRSAEMIADDLASPQLVKYMELITS